MLTSTGRSLSARLPASSRKIRASRGFGMSPASYTARKRCSNRAQSSSKDGTNGYEDHSTGGRPA